MISDIELYTDWGRYKKYFECGIAVVPMEDIENEVPELQHAVKMYEEGRATEIEVALAEEIMNVLATGIEKTCNGGVVSDVPNIEEDASDTITDEEAEAIWSET